MVTSAKKATNIDAYIAAFPEAVQQLLQTIRTTIQAEVPDAKEAIAYDMPTFKLDGRNLVHFAAFKQHIGFYPAPTGVASFEQALSVYKTGRGSVQFPLDKPLPLALIKRMVQHEVKRHAGKPAK
ncbi:iron chaperone [Paraflavitalea pollutisoli]|uniref:iron chaperone n=1 Tax=Paraflavitalea pollutisoli TaxID=3034143 RepID=UPI0023EBC4F9|nr:DUF1801 domain-containing protein [Paraflavitalea sp. H1-2-19X]